MKTKVFLGIFFTLVGTLGMAIPGWTADSSTVLKWATYIPNNPEDPQALTLQWFADEFEKRTNGAYKIKIFWGETLSKVKEIPYSVRDGLADMGDLVNPYFADLFPLNNVGCFVTPMGLSTAELGAAYYFIHEKYPEFKNEFADFNIVALGFRPLESYGMLLVKPHKNLADLKGAKIRSYGKAWPAFIKAVGGNPVSMSTPEMYEAMERGVVDGSPMGITIANRWKVDEVGKYFMGPFTPIMGHSLIMNKEIHDKLPANTMAILDGLGQEYTVKWLKTLEMQIDAIKRIWKENGVKIIPVDHAELMSISQDEGVKAIHQEWIEKAKAKGLKDAEEVIEIFMP